MYLYQGRTGQPFTPIAASLVAKATTCWLTQRSYDYLSRKTSNLFPSMCLSIQGDYANLYGNILSTYILRVAQHCCAIWQAECRHAENTFTARCFPANPFNDWMEPGCDPL